MENNDDTFTPEELAWRLLLDDNINDAPILAFSDENTKEILFEILLTIYVEMIFNHYKMQYLESHVDDDDFDNKFDNFKLDLTQINVDILTNNFDEKIKKIKFILNVTELSRDIFNECKNKRYCTLLFRDLLRDKFFFMLNADYLESHKRYHFVKNSLYQTNKELRNIFCSFELYGKYYKIHFTE
jgi:hypothetical protein